MATDKPRKRSKHLVVQENPFSQKDPPKPTTPTNTSPTGLQTDDDSWRLEQVSERNFYKTPLEGAENMITFMGAGKMSDKYVEFYAFTDSVSEAFTVNYQQIEKLGSPEPIYQYSGTSKQINISWKAIDDDYEGAELENKIDMLKSMTYPIVDESGNVLTPPLVYLEYGPLTEEYASNPDIDEDETIPLGRKSTNIFGYITSLSIDYSSQEMGHRGSTYNPRMITFNVGFQQINRGLVGEYRKSKDAPKPVRTNND